MRKAYLIIGVVTALGMTGGLGVSINAAYAAQSDYKIAATVNDEAISMKDVEDRIKLVLVSSGLPDNPDIRAKIRPQVIEGLIEDQLKLQEARRKKITITDGQVQDGLKIIAEQNKMEAEQFEQILKQQGVPKKTLEGQIRAQLAWNEVIKKVLRAQVDVNTRDVDTRIERMKGKIGQTEYLVAEIFLPGNDPKSAGKLGQFAQRMAEELQAKKAPFGPVAAQFSKASGAEKGGLIGWVQTGQLEPALDKVLQTMDEGQVSDPIRTSNGIYILNIQKKRTITEESIPPREDLTNQIGYERLDRVQQRALLDLKASAFIDRRV